MMLMMTKSTLESDRYVTVQEINEMLEIPKSKIDRHIQRLGPVKKLDIRISYELKEIHATKRINPCDLHLKCNEFDPFLRRIITGNVNWIIYNNVKV